MESDGISDKLQFRVHIPARKLLNQIDARMQSYLAHMNMCRAVWNYIKIAVECGNLKI